LQPERHTRTGAALRHATALLSEQAAQHRMLLLLSDGTPHDAEEYSGRYGLEDVRQAVREARLQSISSLCFTTDQLNGNYLPSVFGEQQSTVLYRPELLPSALTQWLHRLMRL
jgi:nitric oxide reductase NorD protein